MSSGGTDDLELVEVLEFPDDTADLMKYEKVALSEGSDSDEDESLEIVMRKVSARTLSSPTDAVPPPAQRVLTPQKQASRFY
jgi:hypothetical protein